MANEPILNEVHERVRQEAFQLGLYDGKNLLEK